MKHSLLVIMALIFIVGCGNSVPSCNNGEVKETVIQIVKEANAKLISAPLAELFEYNIKNIRTTYTNKETGAKKCDCELIVSNKAGNADPTIMPITYIIELTEDKEVYINVYGAN